MFRDKYPLAWQFHRNTNWPNTRAGKFPESRSQTVFKEDFDVPILKLPPPRLPHQSFGSLLARCGSCRRYSAKSIDADQISALLFATYGCLSTTVIGSFEEFTRPVPSGGGLYPLEIYLIMMNCGEIAPGIYHFNPQHHHLAQLPQAALSPATVADLFLSQSFVAEVACIFVITAVVDRSMAKYQDRGYRYMLFEAGHAAQNATLAATALELGTLSLGGFFDLKLAHFLQLDPEIEIPLYAIGVGVPETMAPDAMRLLRDGSVKP